MTETNLAKLKSLAAIYLQLIELLKESGDERLATLADSIARSLTQLDEMLAVEVDSKTGREMLKGLRQGLRETPKLIASIVPERSAQLVAEFEDKLGCKFTDY